MFSVAAVSMCGKVLGSVQRVILDSALWLRQAGVCDTLMANMVLPADVHDYAFLRECREAGFEYETLVARRQLSFSVVRRLAQLARERRIPILHSHGYKSDAHCLLAARRIKCKWVSTMHIWTEHDWRDRVYSRIDKILLRYADLCIAVSEGVKRVAVEGGVPAEKIEVVHNWIDVQRLRQEATKKAITRSCLGIDDDTAVFLVPARLSREKGHLYLLEALTSIVVRHPKIVCLLAGEGPFRETIARAIETHHLNNVVRILGYRNDLPALMGISDWVVLPSFREGLPLVLLEAFALGKPVIATTVSGVPELVTNGVNGLLVPPGDVQALKEAMLSALSMEASRYREMGEAGRAVVERRFTPEVQIPKIGQLYQKLLAQSGGGG